MNEYKNETENDVFFVAYSVDTVEYVGMLRIGCVITTPEINLDIINNEYELFEKADNLSFIDYLDLPIEGEYVGIGYWADDGKLVIARKPHTRTSLSVEEDTDNFITETTCEKLQAVDGESKYIGMVREFNGTTYIATDRAITEISISGDDIAFNVDGWEISGDLDE